MMSLTTNFYADKHLGLECNVVVNIHYLLAIWLGKMVLGFK